jgi:hypothetical protein
VCLLRVRGAQCALVHFIVSQLHAVAALGRLQLPRAGDQLHSRDASSKHLFMAPCHIAGLCRRLRHFCMLHWPRR